MDSREDKLKKIDILTNMAGAYGKDFTEGTLRMMISILSKYTPTEVEKAVLQLVEFSKFMPSVSEIVERILDHRLDDPTYGSHTSAPTQPIRKILTLEERIQAAKRIDMEMTGIDTDEDYARFIREWESARSGEFYAPPELTAHEDRIEFRVELAKTSPLFSFEAPTETDL